ncbi:MAG: hypothetical protein WCK26_03040, partial [Candidatus Saccharibacteria bacterium]
SNGTIFMAQKIGQNAVYGFLGGTSGSGANNFIFDYQPTGSLGRFRFNGADGNFVGVGSAVYSLNQNYVISGRWSESQVWYSVDGVSTSPVSTDAMTSVPSPYILHYTPRADTYNRIIFYPITLSGADVTTVTNAIKDGP